MKKVNQITLFSLLFLLTFSMSNAQVILGTKKVGVKDRLDGAKPTLSPDKTKNISKAKFFIELETIKVRKENDAGGNEELYGEIDLKISYAERTTGPIDHRGVHQVSDNVFHRTRRNTLDLDEGESRKIDKGISMLVPRDKILNGKMYAYAKLKEADRRASMDDDLGSKILEIPLEDVNFKGDTKHLNFSYKGTEVRLFFNIKRIN